MMGVQYHKVACVDEFDSIQINPNANPSQFQSTIHLIALTSFDPAWHTSTAKTSAGPSKRCSSKNSIRQSKTTNSRLSSWEVICPWARRRTTRVVVAQVCRYLTGLKWFQGRHALWCLDHFRKHQELWWNFLSSSKSSETASRFAFQSNGWRAFSVMATQHINININTYNNWYY